jgi:CheY-like chemotaxis protein
LVKDCVPIETILLIENDPATLVAQSLILRSFGYKVLEAASRGDAWRVCHQFLGPIHLVVAKAIVDNHCASEFVTRLHLLYPQISALFVLDGPQGEWDIGQSMRYRYTCLQKCFPVDTLADTISELLGKPKRRAASSLS